MDVAFSQQDIQAVARCLDLSLIHI